MRRLSYTSGLRLHLDAEDGDLVTFLLSTVRGRSSLISFSCSLAELVFVPVSSYFDSRKGKTDEPEN